MPYESKLDPFKPLIDKWLAEDKKAPRKQGHTAKRIHERLKNEAKDYDCSYRLTAEYVAAKKKELQLGQKMGYLPLIHSPGEAQADFGTADFHENGKLCHEAKYLVLSFPFSNSGYLQLNYGENTECLFEGLIAMFEHAGGVPTEIWFDNNQYHFVLLLWKRIRHQPIKTDVNFLFEILAEYVALPKLSLWSRHPGGCDGN